jgi:hypothetical protein
LELFQLDDHPLKLLRNICEKYDADYRINYLELAMDISSKSEPKVEKLRQFFNKHLVDLGKSKSKSQPYFYDDKGTHYYNKQEDSIRLALYSDKVFRWDKKRFCVHLEYRYSELDALRSAGIVTAKDVVDCNQARYWEKQLDLRIPNFKGIGEYFAKRDLSHQGLNNKGKKYFNELGSLQKDLAENPKLIEFFTPITTDKALEKFFKQAVK